MKSKPKQKLEPKQKRKPKATNSSNSTSSNRHHHLPGCPLYQPDPVIKKKTRNKKKPKLRKKSKDAKIKQRDGRDLDLSEDGQHQQEREIISASAPDVALVHPASQSAFDHTDSKIGGNWDVQTTSGAVYMAVDQCSTTSMDADVPSHDTQLSTSNVSIVPKEAKKNKMNSRRRRRARRKEKDQLKRMGTDALTAASSDINIVTPEFNQILHETAKKAIRKSTKLQRSLFESNSTLVSSSAPTKQPKSKAKTTTGQTKTTKPKKPAKSPRLIPPNPKLPFTRPQRRIIERMQHKLNIIKQKIKETLKHPLLQDLRDLNRKPKVYELRILADLERGKAYKVVLERGAYEPLGKESYNNIKMHALD
jgi:DNA-binding transcriptional regulator GbsR (MarR family)